MSRARVVIDLNSRDSQGLTPVRLASIGSVLHKGQIVTATEPEDGVQARAYVSEIDERLGYAFLHVDIDSMTDIRDEPLEYANNAASNRASAAVANQAVATSAGAAGVRLRSTFRYA